MSSFVRHIPNIITYIRLGLIPIFVCLLIEPSETMRYLAIGIFIIAALTDSIDGYVARKWNAVSDLGKLLDPLADKILVMAALVTLVALRSDNYGEPWVPGWMVILVLARETWVTGLRGVAASRGVIVPASVSGKIKSFFQMIAIIFLLLHDLSFEFGGFHITCQLVGINLLLVSIFISYSGALEYTITVFRINGGEEGSSSATCTKTTCTK